MCPLINWISWQQSAANDTLAKLDLHLLQSTSSEGTWRVAGWYSTVYMKYTVYMYEVSLKYTCIVLAYMKPRVQSPASHGALWQWRQEEEKLTPSRDGTVSVPHKCSVLMGERA